MKTKNSSTLHRCMQFTKWPTVEVCHQAGPRQRQHAPETSTRQQRGDGQHPEDIDPDGHVRGLPIGQQLVRRQRPHRAPAQRARPAPSAVPRVGLVGHGRAARSGTAAAAQARTPRTSTRSRSGSPPTSGYTPVHVVAGWFRFTAAATKRTIAPPHLGRPGKSGAAADTAGPEACTVTVLGAIERFLSPCLVTVSGTSTGPGGWARVGRGSGQRRTRPARWTDRRY